MLTREQVLQSLHDLQDPQLQKKLTDLQFIKDIMIRGDQVNMTIVLSALDDDIKAVFRKRIEDKLAESGVKDTHIRFRQATEFELSGNRTSAESPSGADAAQAHKQDGTKKQGMPKLLTPECKTVIIAIASGKGGVGKSTVTVNLAVALARMGKKVGIMDADIYGFSIPDMMGIEEYPQLVNERIVPVRRFGVDVISMGFFVQDNAPVIWRGPMLGKMLKNFFQEVEWEELDYLLLDLPPGTGDIALDVHQMIPRSKEILVTTPHATAAFVASRAGAMAIHTHHEVLGIVENMAYYECGECGHKDYVFGRGGGAKLAEELHVELLAQIPLGAPDNHPAEPEFSPSVYKADTAAGQLYAALAERVAAKTSES